MSVVGINVSPISEDNQAPTSGVLPGLAATMEVAGIESIPAANVGPTMVGYTREEQDDKPNG